MAVDDGSMVCRRVVEMGSRRSCEVGVKERKLCRLGMEHTMVDLKLMEKFEDLVELAVRLRGEALVFKSDRTLKEEGG